MANRVWVDRRVYIWVWPLSAIIIVGVTGLLMFSVYAIYLEDFGDKTGKKVFLMISFTMLVIGLVYTCIGIYQVFAHEFRELFIVRKVEWFGEHIELSGYYFKKDKFESGDVLKVDEYRVSSRFGRNIATALSYTRHNYKVTLRDGREFYLPGEMQDVDELKALLASKLSDQ